MNTENQVHAVALTSYSTPNTYMMALNFERNTVGVWDGEFLFLSSQITSRVLLFPSEAKLFCTAEELFEGDFNSLLGMAVEDTVAAKFVYDSWSAGN